MKSPKFIKKSKTPPTPYCEHGGSTAQQQIARLDERLGVGVGAHKERTKLNKIIEGENDGR